ncbi:hypothetical protein ACFL59_05615 [Planctomycetota bacterium]
MRVAGVREFRNRVPELMKGEDIVFVTRHGKLSGLFLPLAKPEELPIDLRRELLGRIGAAISAHLEERGVSEDEVLRDFGSWQEKRREARRRR